MLSSKLRSDQCQFPCYFIKPVLQVSLEGIIKYNPNYKVYSFFPSELQHDALVSIMLKVTGQTWYATTNTLSNGCEQVAKRGRGWGVVDATRASLQGSRAASWMQWKFALEEAQWDHLWPPVETCISFTQASFTVCHTVAESKKQKMVKPGFKNNTLFPRATNHELVTKKLDNFCKE